MSPPKTAAAPELAGTRDREKEATDILARPADDPDEIPLDGIGPVGSDLPELAIIGAALIDPSIIVEATATGLRVWYFKHPGARRTWQAMVSLANAGQSVDTTTLVGAMGVDESKALAFFTDCLGAVPSAAHWRTYADLIRLRYRKGEVLVALEQCQKRIKDGYDLDGAVKALRRALEQAA